MKNLLRILLLLVAYGTALILLYFWFAALIDWIGAFWGILVGIFVAPGVVLFPLIYWIAEGAFPWLYVLLDIVSIGTYMLASVLSVESGNDN